MTFESMPKKELEGLHSQLLEKYNSFKAKNLKLDMSRGKPCTQQLDLSMDMLKINDVKSSTGLECRNYGILDGIPECKAIFSEMLEVAEKNVIVMGNSSLKSHGDFLLLSCVCVLYYRILFGQISSCHLVKCFERFDKAIILARPPLSIVLSKKF